MKKLTALLITFIMSISVLGTTYASSYNTNVEWGVNLRSAPSTNSQVFRMLPKGENIQVVEKTNNYWLKIKTQNGTTGFISANSKFTNYSESHSSKADAIIATAKSLIGKAEYDFGTRNHKRLILDCSSFTEYVFEKNGIELKWGTRFQKYAGDYVRKSNLRKGDLVFFSLGNSSEIAHVGIYISNGDFINILDKSKGSDVHIANLNRGYWDRNYVTARRVIE